jgi:biotin carboxylase
MKKLAIIGSGRMAWIMGKMAHEMGYQTYCFSNVAPEFIKEAIDVFYDISIFEKERIRNICNELKVDGVIATTELTIAIAAYVATELGLPTMNYNIATLITDKYRNRECCKKLKDLKQPEFIRIDSEAELKNIGFDYPIILKPTSRGGKRGIIVVDNSQELNEAYKYAKENSQEDPVIIEQYITGGQEYSVESLSCNGIHYIIQVTEKITSGPPHCVELGHQQPAQLSNQLRSKVECAIKDGLTAIGIDNSACHTEIKIKGDEIYLIEFNARPGGDHIAWPLTELSTGYNYIKGAISIASGTFAGVDYSKFINHYSGVFFVTKQSAYLKQLLYDCEKYQWFYQRNIVSDQLQTLEHNDCYNTNYIMYKAEKERPNIEGII